MKFLVMAMAVSSVMTPNAAPAGENEKALQLRPKAAISTAVAQITPAQANVNAPFIAPAANEPELTLASPPTAQESSRSACNGERALCYDAVSGRVVYKPARQFMPDLPGLRPENISIKRHQLVFRYSF